MDQGDWILAMQIAIAVMIIGSAVFYGLAFRGITDEIERLRERVRKLEEQR